MKHIIIVIIFFSSTFSFSQTKKETAYIFFDKTSKETCEIEDGDGNLLKVNKYRKVKENKRIKFLICNEVFLLKENTMIDTCSIDNIINIKFQTVEELNKEISSLDKLYFFKNNEFENIYIIEKISESKIIKNKVYWSEEWTIE